MGAFIEAIDLHKTYRVGKIDVPALRGISFSVQKGEFVTVVGPSGSGKSTLFYLLGGLTRADSGKVIIDGDDFATLSDAERTRMRKRKIGFVFQKFNLLPTLDARSNIAIAQEISGNGDRDPRLLPPHLRFAGTQQAPEPSPLRTFRRRATARRPGPRAGQQTGHRLGRRTDRQSRHRKLNIVLKMLRQSNQELGQTVLMITHNPEAAKYGDRIIHMRDGHIVKPEEDPQWSVH